MQSPAADTNPRQTTTQPDRAFLQQMLSAELDVADPFVADLVTMEAENQVDKLILVPSVSAAPVAVLQALGSVFQNVCAEGHPAQRMLQGDESDLKQIAWHMANTRRYADRRFYKGVGYVDLIESLAQQRSAALFAHGAVAAEDIYANVQPLSGGTANLAVYYALLEPDDTVLGMSLSIGGHLSHGARVNLSGQYYNFVPYGIDPITQQLDYDRIREMAQEHRPKLIVVGYTSYPWAPDWGRFREIADEVGAYLLADVAHTAGLVAAGVMASPVGVADVTSLTTNKTLCGPRAAVVLTTDRALAEALDGAVFPGLQGAPHPNKFAAVAVTMGMAQAPEFRAMQAQIVTNAKALAQGLQSRGVKLAYGGTDTHLLVIDLKPFAQGKEAPLYGEPAARILELAGLVVNRNTVPGDTDPTLATGIRLGTPWVTQRGLDEADMDRLAALIGRLLRNIEPFTYVGVKRLLPRGKVDLAVLAEVRAGVDELVAKAIVPGTVSQYAPRPEPTPTAPTPAGIQVTGWRAKQFLQQATTAAIATLPPEQARTAAILDGDGQLVSPVVVTRRPTAAHEPDRYHLALPPDRFQEAFTWLEALSDGYVRFDADVYRKVQGPVALEPLFDAPLSAAEVAYLRQRSDNGAVPPDANVVLAKPYFVGQAHFRDRAPAGDKAPWTYEPASDGTLRTTPLLAEHEALGARLVPFGGWHMPLRYRSVVAEHNAVRTAAGLFDVGHMGIVEVTGENAILFLDAIFSNYVAWLEDLTACYGFILDPAGDVIDDAVVYRLHREKFYLVVNAANAPKVWQWLNQVNAGAVVIDRERPWIEVDAPVSLRLLRPDPAGDDALTLLALQGPTSLQILRTLAADADQARCLSRLQRNQMLACALAGHDVIVARTGYTGEAVGYEIFVSAADVVPLWRTLLQEGDAHGLLPIGLGARDSLRTEAGLPLWGHELAGAENISPSEAGFAAFVKYHKPFFVGRDALLAKSRRSDRCVVAFAAEERGTRMARMGDPVVDERGRVVGEVTSCVLNGQRRLVGLALLAEAHRAPGTSLAFLPLNGKSLAAGLVQKERVTLPVPITVRRRGE